MSELPSVNTSSATDRVAGNVLPAFSLSAALRLAFQVVDPVAYPDVLKKAQDTNPGIDYSGIRTVPRGQYDQSYLGTDILMPITFKKGNYNRYDSDGVVKSVPVGAWRLPLSVVVELDRDKSLTKTPVVASKSSVKETYGHDDWTIRISGFLLDEPNQPNGATSLAQQRQRLNEFEALCDSIEVQSELFTAMEIYRLTIINIRYSQLPGKPGLVPFQLSCLSDDPIELILQ